MKKTGCLILVLLLGVIGARAEDSRTSVVVCGQWIGRDMAIRRKECGDYLVDIRAA